MILQIWIGEEGVPRSTARWRETVRRFADGMNDEYRLLEIEAKQVDCCFPTLAPYFEQLRLLYGPVRQRKAMSDLIRLSYLIKEGGWYFDLDVSIEDPARLVLLASERVVLFAPKGTVGACCNGALYSRYAEEPLFTQALAQAQNTIVSTNFPAPKPMYVSGPAMLWPHMRPDHTVIKSPDVGFGSGRILQFHQEWKMKEKWREPEHDAQSA